MVASINASTSAGVVTTADTSGILQLQTASTAAVTIDASQNTGFGQTSPGQKVDISTSGDIQARIGNSVTGTQFTYDIGRVASSGLLQFYGNQSGATGYIFSGINGERMRIDTSGNVLIATTNAITGITGAQLTASNTSENPAYINIFRDDTTIGNGQFLGYLQFCGRDATSSLGTAHAYVAAVAEADHGAGDNATAITFGTTPDNSSSMAERMRITSDGGARFSCGNFANSPSSTNAGLEIANNGNSPFINHSQTPTSLQTYYAFINGNGTVGTIKCTGSSTQFNTSSDVRLKKNVVDAPSAITSIQQIGIKSFDWKADDLHQEYGLIAQELDAVAPEAVSHGATEDEMWGVDYSKLVPRMIKAIQELKAINDTQAETINALTARIVALEGA